MFMVAHPMALSQTLALERHTFIGLRRCRGNMFEALEGMLEKSKLPLDPAWPILMHSISALFGLFYVIEGVRRHAPVGLLVGAVVFLLSLIWLITTVRSQVPVSRRDVWVRGRIVVWILLAYQVAYTVAAH